MIEILLIDDDEVDRMTICRALGKTELKAHVTEADTASAGLRLLEKNLFDCVLLDYRLPDKDGLLTLKNLVPDEIKSRTPFVMLTGQNDDQLALKILRAGAQDFLVKDGLSPAQLARAIINAIERQEMQSKNRKISEELENRAHFMEVVNDTMSDGLLVTDEDGLIISANSACRQIFGYTQSEMIGGKVNMLMKKEDAAVHDERIKQYLKTRKSDVIGRGAREVSGERKDGQEIFLEISISPAEEQGKSLFVASVCDITAKKQAEAARHEVEKRLQLITDNMSDIVFLRDASGTLLYVSPALKRHLGRDPKDEIGKNSKHLVFADDLKNVWDPWRKAVFEEKKSFKSTVRLKHKDGSLVWLESTSEPVFDDKGNVTAAVTTSRNVTEQREIENRLRLVTENMNDMIYLFNRDGEIQFVTPSVKDQLGYEIEERVGNTCMDVLHPEDQPLWPKWKKVVMQMGNKFHSVVRYRHKNGTYYWFDSITQPIKDEKGKVTAAVMTSRNVTEQHAAEEKMHMLANNTSDIIMLHGPKGEITYVTPSVTKHLGLTPEQVVGKQSLGVVHPEDKKDLDKNWNQIVLQEGKPLNRDIRFKNKRGEYLWFECHSDPVKNDKGKTIAAVTTSRNINEYKQAEEEALSLGRIVEDSLNEVYIFDAETLNFIMVNRGARENLGYSMEELHKMTVVDLKPEYTKQTIFKMIQPLLEGESEQIYFETTHRRKDGTDYDVEVYLQLSKTGEKPVFVGIVEDVTDKKEADSKLRQAQKMEAIGNLSGGIAHDFNNLLTAIQGSLQLMEMVEDNLSDDAKECLNIAIKSTKRGADLTHRLLAFSRKQTLKPSIIDINELVNGMMPMLRRTIDESIQLETHLMEGEALSRIDAAELENALLNLTVNARDAMPKGGTLTFEVEEVKIDNAKAGDIQIDPGNYILISVSDTGMGMPPEVRNSIFEPFFTTKGVDKGTGLGLSMVYGFVKQSGGHISVYSEVGNGTTFKIYLKSSIGKIKSGSFSRKSIDHKTKETGTILLVEDDEGVKDFITQALKARGYKVYGVEDGPSALLVMDKHKDIDLLLTDVVLPKGMNGPEIGKEFEKKFPGKPIIYSSGYTGKAIETKGWLKSGEELLSKPYDIAVLYDRIKKELAKK